MKVVVGVSGGADSVGLLQLLRELTPEYGLQLHVVHLNHMLRPEAAAEAAFVQQLARRSGLPVTIGYARVHTIAERLRIGIEEAGRLARYRLFASVADRIGADRIAVGHHADDQVETVLFNLLRGTGPGGLAGMPPRHGRVVRPLLCASKEEIASYCRAAGLDWCTDASNLSPEFLRNRIRSQLLPLLRKEFNLQSDRAILRLAEIMREENSFLAHYVQRLMRQLMTEDEARANVGHSATSGRLLAASTAGRGGTPVEMPGSKLSANTVQLALAPFLRLPLALQRRLLRAAVRKTGGSLRHLGYQNVEDCLMFLGRGVPGGTVQLPHGVRVSKSRSCFTVVNLGTVSVGRVHGLSETAANRSFLAQLLVPGKTVLPELGLSISASLVNITTGAVGSAGCPPGARRPAPARLWSTGDGNRACFDFDHLKLPLAVRSRQAGDCLQPFGMQGVKKLKKLFGELRIPSDDRDRVPLVIDQGQILWVVGLRRSQAAPVTRQTRRVLVLEAEQLSTSS